MQFSTNHYRSNFLVVLHEGEHKALYLTLEIAEIFEGWEWNVVDNMASIKNMTQ